MLGNGETWDGSELTIHASVVSENSARRAPSKRKHSEYGSRSHGRCWAELMKRAFDIDVLQCPTCAGRFKRSPARDPPYFKSKVLRRSSASVATVL